MIRLPAILLTVVAAATAYPWTPLPHTRTTAKLSQARRNLGAATLDGKAYFAGGCLTTGKNTQFICDHASDAVDVLDESGALLKTMQLSQPRGWVAVCVNSQEVIMAGGGTSGVTPHSRVADIWNTAQQTMSHTDTALTNGRWGVGCGTVANSTYFVGGKVTVHGYDDAWTSPLIDVYSATSGTWARSPYNLSEDKESSVAVGTDEHLVVASGWRYLANGGFGASAVVETYMTPEAPKDGGRVLSEMKTASYDVGMAVVNGSVYVVSNENIHIVDETGSISSQRLPAPLYGQPSGNVGGGAIPASHIPQNGAVVGPYACFYAANPSAVYCHNTETAAWSMLNCTVEHQGGSIVAVGNSILVAGGFDGTTGKTNSNDVVDVFRLQL